LRLLGGFRGRPIQWNHVQCCQPTLVAMATKFGQIWAIFDKIAYKSVCMPDRPDTFGPTGGDDQGADLCCHGCDAASHFVQVGKKTAWKVLETHDEFTTTFYELHNAPEHIAEEEIESSLEYFTILLYDMTATSFFYQ